MRNSKESSEEAGGEEGSKEDNEETDWSRCEGTSSSCWSEVEVEEALVFRCRAEGMGMRVEGVGCNHQREHSEEKG